MSPTSSDWEDPDPNAVDPLESGAIEDGGRLQVPRDRVHVDVSAQTPVGGVKGAFQGTANTAILAVGALYLVIIGLFWVWGGVALGATMVGFALVTFALYFWRTTRG